MEPAVEIESVLNFMTIGRISYMATFEEAEEKLSHDYNRNYNVGNALYGMQ